MRKNKRFLMIGIIMMTLIFNFGFTNILAEDNSPNFAVNMVTHSEQLKSNMGFYLLPNTVDYHKNPIQIELINNSNKEQSLTVSLILARTNTNGLIVYEEDAYGPNDSLEYNIEDYAIEQQKEVLVPAAGKKLVNFEVDASNFTKIDGIAMGALVVKQTHLNEEKAGIGHVFNYEIPVVFTNDKAGELYKSETLDLEGGKLELISGHKVISYFINNLEPNMATKLNIQAELVNKKDGKVALEKSYEDYSIAPNGILPQYLDWGLLNVKPGDYILKVKANNDKQEWEWEKDITIKPEEAKKVNEESTYKVVVPKATIYISILLLLLTIANHVILLNGKEE